MGKFWEYMNEDYNITPPKIIKWIVIIYAVQFIWNGASNALFYEGYELTVSGTVQTHELKYTPMFRYAYTDVGLRTYAESYYTFDLLGHHELEVGKRYTITYVRTSPWGLHQWMIRKVIKIEEQP